MLFKNSINKLSIQQRLPLLICTLLLIAIVTYGFANYYSLKKVTLLAGTNHLKSLTGQMSESLGQSARRVADGSNAGAIHDNLVQCLRSGGKRFQKEAGGILNSLQSDTNWVSTELLDTNFVTVLRSGKSTVIIPIDVKQLIGSLNVEPGTTRIGNIYRVKNNVYFPIVSGVGYKDKLIGYIVSWKSLLVDQKSLNQFSEILGVKDFFVGNTDGHAWTDLVKPLPGVPFKMKGINNPVEYTDADGDKMIANPQIIPGTPWLLVIATSEQDLFKGMQGFIILIIVVGAVVLAVGIIAAGVMSRSITGPLNRLTNAAMTISKGDYTATASIGSHQNDELGKLANAFNSMVEQVYQTQQELEEKVKARTTQLQSVNEELEAFSYSVSHDLRTPLRAINGYSIMLQEDYEKVLDAEGNRILQNISVNAKMMGELIDHLLAFSRLGKNEIATETVDMLLLAKNVVDELFRHETEDRYKITIAALPPVNADPLMIKQLLLNLISNAIKYSAGKDNPEIEIGFKQHADKITYYIKDNGAGFDMAHADKLFGVFQRLHSQEEFEGTGVGLAFVKRIIEKHRGEIWAEGRPDEGATFYFSLPNLSNYE